MTQRSLAVTCAAVPWLATRRRVSASLHLMRLASNVQIEAKLEAVVDVAR
jgi:hypothetical protein